MPGLAEGLGALPRFRAEVGPFIGVGGLMDVRYLDGSFIANQGNAGFMAGADLSVRVGLGLEGVLGDAGDGLIFLALGIRGDSPSTGKFSDTSLAEQGGTLTAAIRRAPAIQRAFACLSTSSPVTGARRSALLAVGKNVPEYGRHGCQWRADSLAAGLGHALRALPIRPRA